METEEAAPEEESVPGQIFLSHTSLDYPHDDPVERHIIEEVWRQLSEDSSISAEKNQHKVRLQFLSQSLSNLFFLESSFLLG